MNHAKYELSRAGLGDQDSDYDGALEGAVLELMDVFEKQAHSGFSAAMTLKLFSELAQFHQLGPLTSDPNEWVNVGEGVWQNRRRASAFSRDGGTTWYDIEDASLNSGDHWDNHRRYPKEGSNG
jgi:hypothetical protein